MHRIMWVLLAVHLLPTEVLAQCQFFKIHPGVFEHLRGTGPCRGSVLTQDTDGDKDPDWMYAEQFGDVWLPADRDIDNDGVENVRDPHVFEAVPGDEAAAVGFPSHLLAKGKEAQTLQRQIASRYDVLVIPYSSQPSVDLLLVIDQALDQVHQFVSREKLARLRYIYVTARSHQPSAAAYYLEPSQSILLPDESSASRQELLQTLWHEIGHAVVFSAPSPQHLLELSHAAGWKVNITAQSFYHPSLLRPFSGLNDRPDAFPTLYAMRSVHEWYAELFAGLVEHQGKPGDGLSVWHKKMLAYLQN